MTGGRYEKPVFWNGAHSAFPGQMAVSTASHDASPGDAAKRFIGTWRLVSIRGASTESEANRGPDPTGVMYYDSKGQMAVQIMPNRERPIYTGTLPTPNEARAAILGYTSYFGTYTIDERKRTVTHHRKGNINPGGLGDYVRRYEFLSDDRIILRPVESTSELTWDRIT